MKKQAYNPYLPLNEYVPDGESHVFGDRLYVYGSHDLAGGERYCMQDRFNQQWTDPDCVDRSVPDRIVEHGVCMTEIRLKAITIDQTGKGNIYG